MRAHNLLPLLTLAIAAPQVARADDAAASVSVAAMRLDRAILMIGRQTGASIGLSDPSLAAIRTHTVSGRLPVRAALARMLAGTRARARRVGPAAFIIERAPPRPTRPAPTPPSPPPPPEEPEEIVVTASKRGTPLAEYPGMATIIDGDALSLADAGRGTDAIEARAASLTSTHLGPGRNKLFIRGIADSSFTGPTQSTVGQYWGNMRLTYSAPDPSLRLYDVQRVEVLEGPQGTLYGAGALGGIVRVVPNPPDLDRAGGEGWASVQATQHGDPGGDAGALVNVPIVAGRIGLRALGYVGRDGGYIDDRLRGRDDVNRVRTYGARGSLRFVPDPDWTIDLSATFQSIAGDDAQYADRDGDGLHRGNAVAQPYRNDYLLAEATITGNVGDARFVSSTGITDQYVAERFDATAEDALAPGAATAEAASVFDQESRIRMIATETRLSRRDADGGGWLIGVSGMTNSARLNRDTGPAMFTAPAAGVENRVDEATLFGEGTLVPARGLAVTLGGRLTWSRLSGTAEDVPMAFAFRVDPQASASRDYLRALPSAALSWTPDDRLTLFARVQQGYRPGGLSINTDFIERFQGDRILTGELGARWSGDGVAPVDVALTLAATRWENIQADLIDGRGFPTTANIGDGRVHSLGAQASMRPLPGLSLDASLTLNDSKVIAARPVLVMALLDADALARQTADALPNVAGVSARAGVDYVADLGRYTLRLSGYGRYVGKSRLGIGPELGQPQGDYLDTGLDLRIGSEARGVSLTLTNVLDERGNRFALGSPFQVREGGQITPLRPRTIRLGFDMRW